MTAKTPLILYTEPFWISPFVFSVFVTLKEKGLDFELKTVALHTKEYQQPGYRDPSITGRVPALVHGDFWLGESSAIVEYLDEAFPETPRVMPADVRQRARARQVLAWLRTDLGALRENRPTTSMFYEPTKQPLNAAGELAAAKLLHVTDLLLPQGATSLFDAWSVADSDLAFMLHRLILNGHDVPARIRKFAEVQWSRPSVKEYVVRPRPAYVPY